MVDTGSGYVPDTFIQLIPCFNIPDGKLEEFKAGMAKFYELAKPEEKLVFYGFTVSEDGKKAICREAYVDAEGL